MWFLRFTNAFGSKGLEQIIGFSRISDKSLKGAFLQAVSKINC